MLSRNSLLAAAQFRRRPAGFQFFDRRCHLRAFPRQPHAVKPSAQSARPLDAVGMMERLGASRFHGGNRET
jgi:hypothetical protein